MLQVSDVGRLLTPKPFHYLKMVLKKQWRREKKSLNYNNSNWKSNQTWKWTMKASLERKPWCGQMESCCCAAVFGFDEILQGAFFCFARVRAGFLKQILKYRTQSQTGFVCFILFVFCLWPAGMDWDRLKRARRSTLLCTVLDTSRPGHQRVQTRFITHAGIFYSSVPLNADAKHKHAQLNHKKIRQKLKQLEFFFSKHL